MSKESERNNMICLTQYAQWMNYLRTFWRNEEGQGAMEYMLLLSLMVILVLVTMGAYTGPLGSYYATVLNEFTSALNQSGL
jgi:Flp pilus assembly pilin Flp